MKKLLYNLLWIVGSLLCYFACCQVLPSGATIGLSLRVVVVAVIALANLWQVSPKVRQIYFGTVTLLLSILLIVWKLDLVSDIMQESEVYIKELFCVINILLVLSLLTAIILRIYAKKRNSDSTPASRNYLFGALILLSFAVAMPNMFNNKVNHQIVNDGEGYIYCKELNKESDNALMLIVEKDDYLDTLYVTNPKYCIEDYDYSVGEDDYWVLKSWLKLIK